MLALAYSLRSTPAAVEAMPAAEFADWQRWLEAERVGAHWERRRHAELMAATHNGACTKAGGGLFDPSDFLHDPWAAERPPAGREAITRELARMWQA